MLELPKSEKIEISSGFARIKFDKFNQKIKILDFEGNLNDIIQYLVDCKKNQVSKISTVISKENISAFREQGFIMEAKIEQLLNGKSGYFLSKFLTPERKISTFLPEEEEVLIHAREYSDEEYIQSTYTNYSIRTGTIEDAPALAQLYDDVFETYPSPLNNPDFIKYAMDNDVLFKVVIHNEQIISAASADMDPLNLNAEMTDCATLNSYRGAGHMGRLIFELENEVKTRGYKVFFSTARATSKGMNIVFSKHDYVYGGRLVNHCHICGQFENLNIWLKVL